MTISFLFPHPVDGPTGGYKVVYEYANRLAADGHKVYIVYSGSIFWKKKPLYFKLTNCFRYIQHQIKGYSGKKWFNLDSRVKETLSLSLNQRHTPKSDIYICTSPYTAMYLKDYNTEQKYYLIQGYENWGNVDDRKLRETYHYPLRKIVISHWLQHIIEQEEHEQCTLIPNGFDFTFFKLTTPIAKKNPHKITMLYHNSALKDCATGFKALDIIKKTIPQLRVNLFGIAQRPKFLPEWYDYFELPDQQTLNEIYNNAAIFLATSKSEGWGLTIGEAMICGQAIVCTGNNGYKELAINGINALICNVGDSEALANAVLTLIHNDELRYQLALNGNERIKSFTWDKSHNLLKQALGI